MKFFRFPSYTGRFDLITLTLDTGNMSRNRYRKSNKRRLVFYALAGVVLVGGFLAIRSHNKASVLQAVTTPGARNNVRREHMELLSAAITNYVGQKSKLPVTVPTTPVSICSRTGAACKTAGLIDLMFMTSSGYMDALPNDPSGGPGQHTTGYTIVRLPSTNELKISAPRAENGVEISEVIRYR